MKLTEHFTIEEMLDSQTAVRFGIDEQFSPPDYIKNNLLDLCSNVLEPVRLLADCPIIISSGYRCNRVNELIGGAETSQHVKGQASDIYAVCMDVENLYQLIKSSGIEFDQLIQEFSRWVHVSYTPVGINRKQCLRAIKTESGVKYIDDSIVA